MSIKIGHASIDENGKASDGKIGDQTTKEVCIRTWYNKPWNVYLECTDIKVAGKAASNMDQMCANNNIGYDQGQRLTMYNSIVANEGNVLKAKGETDCSAAVSAAYRLAGLNILPACTTRNLKAALLATGKFKAYTDAAHIASDAHAKRGGIYLSEGHHVVMALEDGAGKSTNPYKEPTNTVLLGSSGEGVKWVQWELKEAGYDLKIDGDCGPVTDKAIRAFQKSSKITVDGKAGAQTRKLLNTK